MIGNYESSQSIAYRILSKAVANKKISHAYLFETNGSKDGLDIAISFAKTLLCPNKYFDNKNCGNCSQCSMIDENNFTELKIINPDGLWIKKEQLIDLQDEFNKKSIETEYKVYIINQADRLNTNSANTILKFIEEPPEGIIAILVVDNIYQLLDTIVSRCQTISLNNNISISDTKSTAAKILECVYDSQKETIDLEQIKDNIEAVIKFIMYYEQNEKKVLLHMNNYWFNKFNDKLSIMNAIQMIIYFYKDCLYKKMGFSVEIYNDYIEKINYVVERNELKDISYKIKVYNDNYYYLNNNANLNLLMDKIIIELGEGEKND